jgi:hypothetical protein
MNSIRNEREKLDLPYFNLICTVEKKRSGKLEEEVNFLTWRSNNLKTLSS